ncbi:MAG: hypothetical protein ACRC8F_05155 [Cetobacterium sp.]|uniref:hypothetical protein n=1 Tax=Cetobacterium sp. TaxID=2071632 RepID=UPI003F2FF339
MRKVICGILLKLNLLLAEDFINLEKEIKIKYIGSHINKAIKLENINLEEVEGQIFALIFISNSIENILNSEFESFILQITNDLKKQLKIKKIEVIIIQSTELNAKKRVIQKKY